MRQWYETVRLQAAMQVAAVGQPRHAVVTSVDASSHAVKVTLQPEGLESGWIPDATLAAGGLRIMCPTEIGSQVIVLPMEGDAEHPVLVGRIFDVSTMPAVSPGTGTTVAPGEIAIVGQGGAFIHLSGDTVMLGGKVTLDGNLVVTGDVVAAGVSLCQHVHANTQPGQGTSGKPVANDG